MLEVDKTLYDQEKTRLVWEINAYHCLKAAFLKEYKLKFKSLNKKQIKTLFTEYLKTVVDDTWQKLE